MTKCSKYVPRFKEALKFRGLKFPQDIIDVMGKRAKSDRSLDKIINDVVDILEPPNCTKSHCQHHTTFSFCNCSLNRVPGKCDLHRAYRKGVKEREEKQFQERLTHIPEKFLPLTPENEQRVRTMNKYRWAEFLESQKNDPTPPH